MSDLMPVVPPRRRGHRWRRRSLLALVAAALVGVGVVDGPSVDRAAAAWSISRTGSGSAKAQTLAPATGLAAGKSCTPSSPTVMATAPVATFNSSGSGSVSLTVPAAAQVNDLLIVNITKDMGSAPTAPSPSWSLVVTGAASSVNSWVYEKLAASGDAGTTVSWTGGAVQAAGGMLVVRNAAGVTTAGESAATMNNNNSSTITAPSVTPGVAGSLMVVLDSVKVGSATNFTTPTGMTPAYSGQGSGFAMAGFTELRATTGSTGTRTSTTGAGGSTAAVSLLVRPGGYTLSVDVSWTATTTPAADGYTLQRDSQSASTISGRATTSASDTPVTQGASHTYTLIATLLNWRSTSVTTTVNYTCP